VLADRILDPTAARIDMIWIVLPASIVLCLACLVARRAWLAWTLPVAVLLLTWGGSRPTAPLFYSLVVLAFAALATLFAHGPLRRKLVSSWLMPTLTPILPRMSDSERIAIEAGTVGWENEFFTGAPDWKRLLEFKPRELSAREQAFLAGPVEEVCALVRDWDVLERGDLSEEAWEFLKKKGFFGMIIPESYGGLGFSAAAHSTVVCKLSSRSVTLAVTVMVPNSLGPAELLLHYGTQAQKDHFLPRLARGEEIPAFALTEPRAGSDAGSMLSTGVVCRGTWQGRETLGMRLNWDKRYITLAPVATVLGLAFKLYDPEQLLGGETELDITCALVPADLPGIEVGERHDPLGVPFMNGPTRGQDVFVPLDSIIGGPKMAGQGWKMLMQSLAAGRGISLPSMATGAAMLATRVAGAHATVREQFKVAIGRFEGVEEKLARIAGTTYGMDAARRLTAGAVDAGEKPSVASAIVKCYLTEGMRSVVNDAMDVLGGSGICLGPRNVLGPGYAALPIGITVEGANILTRSMIIFGQGAIRCHPFVQDEMRGAFERDLERFDRAFFGHVGFVFSTAARCLVSGLTGSAFLRSPVAGPSATLYRRLGRMSSAFALAADVAMGTLGGTLKRREAITGRLADCLAWMYLASAALKRFHDEGSKERDLPYATWFVEHALYQAQEAYVGLLQNLPLRPAAWALRALVFPFGARWTPPSDRLAGKLAEGVLDGRPAREHLSHGIYLPPRDEQGLGQLEEALEQVVRADAVQRKMKEAVRQKLLDREPLDTLIDRAQKANIITAVERDLIARAERARERAIAVDSFPQEKLAELAF
jgi:acyl-CoA dehydrogenase